MSDLYRLVFRGEVLEGQHPAVVRSRLAQAGPFDDAVLDKLFSGRPVVLKREADRATAARFQLLFKQAGARLRVVPVAQGEAVTAQVVPAAAPSGPPAATPADPDRGGFQLLPPGADILREDERAPWQPREVDTAGLALEKARFVVAEDAPAPAGPDVSHLSVAEAGADLGPRREVPAHPVRAPDLDVAAAGERLAPPAVPDTPAVDFSTLRFEVAPAGAALGQGQPAPAPAAPDVSHLTLAEPD